MIRLSIVRLAVVLGFLLGFPGGLASAWQPVRAHPQNPYILEFRGKPTLLRAFAESYSSVVDSGLPFIPYLDVLKRDGMNLTRVWCLGFPPANSGGQERFLQPWPRIAIVDPAQDAALDGFGKWDLSVWDESYFVRLKAFAQAASDRGIVVEFTLFSTFYEFDPITWDETPFNPLNNIQGYGPNNRADSMRLVNANLLAVQKAAVRRVVRELNEFDNVYFEIQNEPFWNEPGVKDDQDAAFQNAMLAEIRDEESTLPNRHLVGHNFPQQLAALSPDFDVINEHYPIPVAVPNTPVAGAEALLQNQYFRGKILALDETDCDTALQTRLEAWMFLIGGGGIYNGLDAHDMVYSQEDPSGDNALGNAMRQTVRNIGSYMDQMHLVALRRNLGWVTGGIPSGATLQASASPDQQYVAYLHHGKRVGFFTLHYDPIDQANHNVSLRVSLDAGAWRAVWTRPSDLAVLKVEEFTHGGGEKTLQTVTYQADVALRIDRTGPGDITPPPPPSGLGAVSNPDGSITLTWEPSPAFDLAGYRVYRSLAPDVPIDSDHLVAELGPGETTYTDHPAVPNTSYYYVVAPVDQEGNTTSVEASAPSILPDPNLRISINPVGQFVLEWNTTLSGWTLQESPNPAQTPWIDSTLIPTVAGDLYQVTITITPQRRFFKLEYRSPESLPELKPLIDASAGKIVLNWPAAWVDWRLQESPDLGPGSWVNCTVVPVLAGDQCRVTITLSAAQRFFRLMSP